MKSQLLTTLLNLARTIRNFLFDWKYGGFVGGYQRNPVAGANGTGATDYAVMEQIFQGVIEPSDVLVDVGCGYGRIINWWLSRGHRGPIYGIEMLEEVAAHTRRRLKRFENVTILSGDACGLLPKKADVLYLFNPFSDPAHLQRLLDRAFVLYAAQKRLKIVYYACELLGTVMNDNRWVVERKLISLPSAGHFQERHRHAAIIQMSHACKLVPM